MKKGILLSLLIIFLGLSSAFAQGRFLGSLDPNPCLRLPAPAQAGAAHRQAYNPDSVNNPYGRYGSPYSPDSINNPYGSYGSPYSPYSATNPYAIAPLRVYTIIQATIGATLPRILTATLIAITQSWTDILH